MSWNVLRLGALPFPNIVPDVDPRDSKVPLEVWLVGAVPRDRGHRRRHPDRRRAVVRGRGEEFWGIFASLAFGRLSLDVVRPQPLWRGDGRLRSSPAFEPKRASNDPSPVGRRPRGVAAVRARRARAVPGPEPSRDPGMGPAATSDARRTTGARRIHRVYAAAVIRAGLPPAGDLRLGLAPIPLCSADREHL